MATSNTTSDREFRYVLQWFNEFSELQREDFVPIVTAYIVNRQNVYMNGVVNSLQNSGCDDKPMSLFQCRMKLFKEWTPKWPEEMKQKLKQKINELDPKIGEKLEEELATAHLNGNSSHTNGNSDNNGHAEDNGHIDDNGHVEDIDKPDEDNVEIDENEENNDGSPVRFHNVNDLDDIYETN